MDRSFRANILIGFMTLRDTIILYEHVSPRPASGREMCFPSRDGNLPGTLLPFLVQKAIHSVDIAWMAKYNTGMHASRL